MLPASEIDYQGGELRGFLARGGDAEAWYRSKGFTPDERRQIEDTARLEGNIWERVTGRL